MVKLNKTIDFEYSNLWGVGPVTAYKLIKEYNTIERAIEHLKKENENPDRKKKFMIPDPFNYVDARELFMNPDVISDLKDIEVHIELY